MASISGAEKLKNNKSIALLDAAEKGGYGVVSVVCVSAVPVVSFVFFWKIWACPVQYVLYV